MNRLFLTAITGECCLMYLHGIKPRGYNPFVLLRTKMQEAGISLPHKQKDVLSFLRQVFQDNGIKEHRLLSKCLSE